VAVIGLSVAALVALGIPVAYPYLILAGAARGVLRHGKAKGKGEDQPKPPLQEGCRFAIAVPAHDEAAVIGATAAALRRLDYPAERFDVYVAADHCADDTAALARQAGAACFERAEGPRGGKGAALSWLFERIWETGVEYDAVVVFDADTRADPGFLRAMARRLDAGVAAVQGQHRIRNPQDGWYPALADAMFRLNNRVFNQGRANLGLSAMNMGDSICLRGDVLRRTGWGEGLTEDYDLRARLLLDGLRIAYEPEAAGYGEAPATWAVARRQRERWLAGTYHSARRSLGPLLRQGIARRDPAMLDAAAQMVLPAYSTLTVAAAGALLLHLALHWIGVAVPAGLVAGWLAVLGLLLAFPVLGLALDRAPLRAFLVILSGPLFVAWRTALAVGSRFLRPPSSWVRTPRRGEDGRQDV
jgi:cellulose synthase/poly-beta-1,6-N-acetylglucosamine synthase-like glycosyltransferase